MAGPETRGGSHLNFHYDREERLAGRESPSKDEGKGLFKRNRSLAIILLDVVVIIIMFVLLQFIFTPGRSWSRAGNFRTELETFRFEDEIFATVEVTRVREDRGSVEGEDTLVTIRFMDRDPVLDALPAVTGDSITATAVFAADEVGEGAPLVVEVNLPTKVVELSSTPRE